MDGVDDVVDRRLLVPVSHEIIPIGPNNAASFFFFFPSFLPLSFSLSFSQQQQCPFFFFFPSPGKKKRPFCESPSIVLISCCRLSPAYSFSARLVVDLWVFLPYGADTDAGVQAQPEHTLQERRNVPLQEGRKKRCIQKKKRSQCFNNEAKGLREQGTLKNKNEIK